MVIECNWCASPIQKKKESHRFCSDTCRKKWHRKDKGKAIKPDFLNIQRAIPRPTVPQVQTVTAPTAPTARPVPVPAAPQVPQAQPLPLWSFYDLPESVSELMRMRQEIEKTEGSVLSQIVGFGAGFMVCDECSIQSKFIAGAVGSLFFGAVNKAYRKDYQKIEAINQKIIHLNRPKPKFSYKRIKTEETAVKHDTDRAIVSGEQYRQADIPSIGFKGKYLYLLGDPSPGFYMLVTGLPGNGKSTFTIQFAQYLKENHGKVLYLAAEQPGYNKPLQNLLKKYRVTFDVHRDPPSRKDLLAQDIDGYKFVVFDSVNHMQLTADDIADLRKEFPNVSFICIMQSTKDGNFKGAQQFLHDCDIRVKLERPNVKQTKSRYAAPAEMPLFTSENS